MEVPNGIVLFHYKTSPYARRVVWYLTLRGIPYGECITNSILPRPELEALGVKYRRTPTMAVGRDIYVDSRMILGRLEELFPPSEAHPALSSSETAGLAALLNKFAVDAGVFTRAVQMMPTDRSALQDPSFVRDRADFFGKGWTIEGATKRRPDAIAHMRHCFDIAESLFVDGRQWVAGTEGPSFADLEGIWAFDWLISDLQPPQEYFSEAIYPNVYGWRTRFKTALRDARASGPKPMSLASEDAVRAVLRADYSDNELTVDAKDPLGLQEGASVKVFPTDGGGYGHEDKGRLVKLTKNEVAIVVAAKTGEEVRIHAPRWQFRIQQIAAGAKL